MSTIDSGQFILLAEDDPILRLLLSRVLTSAGYRVLSADDGVAALELARDFDGRIDMLLTDFSMPRMNGVDLAMTLTRERPDTKVLLVSAQPGLDVPEAGRAWASLQKPFPLRTLISQVITLMEPAEAAGAVA